MQLLSDSSNFNPPKNQSQFFRYMQEPLRRRQRNGRTLALQILLFGLSFLTMLLAGAELYSGRYWLSWGIEDFPEAYKLRLSEIWLGLPYAVSFMTFLAFHEFGHYFTAVYHKVKSSLPYFIPVFIPIPGLFNIGSFGAVIRLRQVPDSTRKFYDIGIAGPLAGFVVSIFLLVYGFTHLPEKEAFILEKEPVYVEVFGEVPEPEELIAFIEKENAGSPEGEGQALAFYAGSSLLYEWLKNWLPEDPTQIPSQFDVIRYPYLFVGYLTLFFTALNLLPMGQLDGGHVMYGMFGRKVAGRIARGAVFVLLYLGGTGFMNFRNSGWTEWVMVSFYGLFVWWVLIKMLGRPLWKEAFLSALIILSTQVMLSWNFPELQPNAIWLVYTWMVMRFVGLDHPRAWIEHRVSPGRKVLGWLAILIFILCFTPTPLGVVG
ncbi:MAG: site-2 protease family protein [Bacteroidota bacterium]